jgi:septal ring factor EnvC (AmiA/AmiB activator)
MSEERFDRLENAIAAIAENMNSMHQNINALRDDVASQRQRIDSIEGTIVVTIRDGFESMRNYLDDLNHDLAANERQT